MYCVGWLRLLEMFGAGEKASDPAFYRYIWYLAGQMLMVLVGNCPCSRQRWPRVSRERVPSNKLTTARRDNYLPYLP